MNSDPTPSSPRISRDFSDRVVDSPGVSEQVFPGPTDPGRSTGAPDRPDEAPRKPTSDSTDETWDRSAILGHDGRVLAGWALRFIIVAIAAFLGFRLLGYVWIGILPIILALILATVLWPVSRAMRNKGVPGALAALTTLLGFFVILVAIVAAMAPTVRSQGQQVVDQASDGIDQIIGWLQGPPLNLNMEQFNLDGLIDETVDFLRNQSQNILSGLSSGISIATTIVATLFIMLVITFFILKDGEKFLPMVRRYTGYRAGWHLSEVLTRSWNTLSGYIQTQAIVSFVDALLIGIGLLILQIPMAVVLAVITFFGGFIPIVGAFAAGALAVVVALVTNGFTDALIVLVIILAVQQIEGNILQPALQSKAMNLHAAVVLLSVTIGSALFGILGAFLAVPFAAVVGVWIRYHSEMVGLRAGEITVDDMELATAKGRSLSSREAFIAVRDQMKNLGRKGARKDGDEGPAPEGGSTAASKSDDNSIAEEAADEDLSDSTTDGTVSTDEEHVPKSKQQQGDD